MCCGLEGVQLLLSDSHYVSVSLSEDSRDGTLRLSTSLAKIRGSSMTSDSHEAALRILRILRKDSQIRNPGALGRIRDRAKRVDYGILWTSSMKAEALEVVLVKDQFRSISLHACCLAGIPRSSLAFSRTLVIRY